MINIPVKQIIVNSDSQVTLLEEDGTAYTSSDVSATNPLTGFILQGWLGLVKGTELGVVAPHTRVRVTNPSSGAAEITTYTLTATSNAAGARIRVQWQSLDLTGTEFQNIPLVKHYQIPANSSIDAIGADIAAAITADLNAPATASYDSGSDTLTITAKEKGVVIRLYSEDGLLPAVSVSTPAALPVNTYDYLKNIEWSKNITMDRNLEYAPLPGASYTSYYFEVVRVPPVAFGGNPLVSEKNSATVTGYKLWVSSAASTLKAALDDLATDVNIAIGS